MSISFPTLDLGAIGAQIDAAVQADNTDEFGVVEQPAPLAVEQAVVTPVEAPPTGAAGVGTPGHRPASGVSAAPPEPAAEAGARAEPGDDGEAAYKARFETEYAERSKADLSKLRSSLDRRYADLDRRHREVADLSDEAEAYIARLERELGEYDPDAVAGWRQKREGVRGKHREELSRRETDLRLRRSVREQRFPELYPEVDPHDPEILAAFESGDTKLELALIRAAQARAEAAAARKQVSPAAASMKASPAPPEATKPAPERDTQGRFLPAERTRELEKLRGNDGLTLQRAGGMPQEVPTTVVGARKVFAARMDRLLRNSV